ncbi:hypothetical protein, partial [Streptosporangium sp. NPDC001681]|uniref:hypothetical protein n=1 Tax=Streptosporangium sp. NPDC001681 TaxID=3154395 RepID=UPI00331A7D67
MVEETEGIRLVKEPGEAGRSAGFFGLDVTGEQSPARPRPEDEPGAAHPRQQIGYKTAQNTPTNL